MKYKKIQNTKHNTCTVWTNEAVETDRRRRINAG